MSDPSPAATANASGPQPTTGRYFGKYRALVINNVDPMLRGRIQVQVPGVLGMLPSSWCEPCLPVGGPQFGFVAVPMIGATVWVEFEAGDPDRPIWTGTFFRNAAEVPALSKTIPPAVPGMSMTTPLQNGLVISDVPGPAGGIMLKGGLATILINDTGITIQNGQGASILMTGPQVIVNAGALTVI